jgi:peptide subunit release factor 1 (eRF1)
MNAELHDLPRVLKRLQEAAPPPGGVLSAYLDTSPPRVGGEAERAYLLAFRDGCKTLRAALDPSQRERFQAAVEQAEAYLGGPFVPHHPGLAIFAAAAPGFFQTVPLPEAPADAVTWAALPELEGLAAALDEHERVAVALFDQERARLFTVYLGEVEARREIRDALPPRHESGGWSARVPSPYASKRAFHVPAARGTTSASYNRHHEDLVLRHARRTARALAALARARPFDRLLLGGPSEALAVLRRQLPRPLRAKLSGTLRVELFAGEADVLRAAREAGATLERRAERAMVAELLEAAGSPNVALGVDATLAALAERRVHVLFVAQGAAGEGSECAACGRLVAGAAGRCPVCGGPTAPVPNLGSRAILRAAAQGARVETVAGEAAALLQERGGLGAWTRY